ncbi:MAG: Maf family protein [Gemmataceae bacterium]|nr:Maf family protein [Gemmataceae bacterium]
MASPTDRLILASGSPARRELLARLGRPFEVITADIEEPLHAGTGDPRSYVAEIAWRKAAAVAPRVDRGIIIAADTVGWLDGKPVLKPDDEADARRILTALAGRDHELWTGVVLWRRPDDLQIVWQELSPMTMQAFPPGGLDEYIATRQWVGCSGAYAIQEGGDPLLSTTGSITNVIGLPMESLVRHLAML